jgi:hypothetical protein
LIAFLKTLQRLKQEWKKSPALGPGKQRAITIKKKKKKNNLVWFGEIERK